VFVFAWAVSPQALANAWAQAPGHAAGMASITPEEIEQHLRELASPELEGRDSPSQGLRRAARYIAARMLAAGIEPGPGAPGVDGAPGGTESPTRELERETRPFMRSFTRRLPRPLPAECSLVLEVEGEAARTFTYGTDFVPLAGCVGSAAGEVVFLGYGIDSRSEKYDEIRGGRLKGKIALILEGEPRHKKKFEGYEVTAEANLWEKVDELGEERLAGILIARRAPEQAATGAGKKRTRLPKGVEAPAPAELSFRHTYAYFLGVDPGRTGALTLPKDAVPTLEITLAAASAILGVDVEELADRIDKRVRPMRVDAEGRRITMASMSDTGDVAIDNVVGMIRGSDPVLAEQYVVLGAHYDHLGVDQRGRIGCGADDNASGTSALIEVGQALAAAEPRRSILLVAFAAEEDGLLGSKAFCEKPPIEPERVACMVNMDMLGFGDARSVAVLGINQNPTLEDVLDDARRLSKTGVKTIVTGQGEELFQRSDHYPFHQIGIPVLFFFEGLPISRNKDYHSWRDTIDLVDQEKILNSTRLIFNTVWLLANDDDRPPSPSR
jgi:hypothetical protein